MLCLIKVYAHSHFYNQIKVPYSHTWLKFYRKTFSLLRISFIPQDKDFY